MAALQNLVKIMSLYYQYMETYMGPALFAVSLQMRMLNKTEIHALIPCRTTDKVHYDTKVMYTLQRFTAVHEIQGARLDPDPDGLV